MRFGLSSDQVEYRDAVRAMLAKHCPPSAVRAAWDAPPGELDRQLFGRLSSMGVTSVLVPEERGGLGLDMCTLVPLLEECGRAGVPHPVIETAAVAAPLLPPGGLERGGMMLSACLGGAPASCALDADALVVDDGGSLLLVEKGDLALEPRESVDRSRRLADVAGIAEGAGAVLAAGTAEVEAALGRAALGAAAVLVGLGQAMLDMTVAHVGERRQFGAPVGSFQAVKHHLADALTELEFARAVVYKAAWSQAHRADGWDTDISTAKAMASESAGIVGRHALQCHGAIGYTVEYDLHLFLKRATALSRAFGDAAWHRRKVGWHLGLA